MAFVYSFAEVMAAISGPNGAFNIGAGAGVPDGGITVVMTEDKNTMSIGADAKGMHSLHAGKSGTVTVRLQKVSPTNKLLSEMYKLDTSLPAQHGRNTITIRDLGRGDVITARECAFAKFADVTYGKEGGEMVWTFHSVTIDFDLGDGQAVAA